MKLDGLAEKPVAYTKHADGWRNQWGYPVTPWGAPDWCSRCSRLTKEFLEHDRNWTPGRCMPGSGLCAACAKVERQGRERAAMNAAQPTPDPRATAMKGRTRDAAMPIARAQPARESTIERRTASERYKYENLFEGQRGGGNE